MKRCSLLISVGVAAGLLTGCASSPEATRTTAAPGSTPAATSPARANAAPERAAAEADPLTCLQGTWLADNAFFLELIREFGDEVQAVDGQVILHFAADGTLTTEYQDWTISAVAEGVEVQIVRAGLDRGAYTVGEQTLALRDTDMGSTLVVRRGSLEMAVEPHPAVYDGAAYSCDVNAATIETSDGALELTRR